MSSNELISIIMPCYNCEKTIAQTIDSIIMQTYENWELLIIDDASSDNSRDIVTKYMHNDNRIQLLINQSNQGVSYTRNIGVARATGNYLCFLDGDDLWPDYKLSIQLKYMQEHEVSISVGYFVDFTSDINKGYLRKCPKKITFNYLLNNNCVLLQTVMVSSDIKAKIHFEPQRHEDFILALSLLKQNIVFGTIDKVLTYRRRTNDSLTANKVRSAYWRWQVYRKALNMSFIRSSWHLGFYIAYMMYFKLDHIIKRVGE